MPKAQGCGNIKSKKLEKGILDKCQKSNNRTHYKTNLSTLREIGKIYPQNRENTLFYFILFYFFQIF